MYHYTMCTMFSAQSQDLLQIVEEIMGYSGYLKEEMSSELANLATLFPKKQVP